MSRQQQIVLAVMQEGLPIDQRIALRRYNIKALSTIISQLRQKGYQIEKTYIPEGRRLYVRYSLV